MPQLHRGDLLPEILTPPPGPRSRAQGRRLAAVEAPNVNTLRRGGSSILWAEACGANVLDIDGNRYIDCTSGFGAAAMGHRHSRVVEAVRQQSERLLHGLGDVAAHPKRVELAERLCALAPVNEPRVHFAISGADAVEIALASARLATGRSDIVAFAPAYHGTTLGALAASSRPAFREPFAPWLNSRVRRLPYGVAASELSSHLAGGEVACVLVEPLVGREGILLPPSGWLGELAAQCREHGTLMAVDEIFTGCARSGWMWAVEADDVRPDLLICGKALGGGVPIAAVVGTEAVMQAWEVDDEALHTATHLAHPLGCAAALAVLDVIQDEELIERARMLGASMGSELRRRLTPLSPVREVRGRGALWGIELGDAAAAESLVLAARRRGLLLLAGGEHGRVVQVCPPLCISQHQLDCLLNELEATVADLAAG